MTFTPLTPLISLTSQSSLMSRWRDLRALLLLSALSGALTLSALCLQAARAEVGDDCTQGDAFCGVGEVCVPDGRGQGERLCTRRCTAAQPCPEAYECTPASNLYVCLPPPPRARLGERCDDLPCEQGTICLAAGVDGAQVCVRPCFVAGACPEGFECRLGGQAEGVCVATGELASVGEPCDLEGGRACVSELTCLAPEQERALPYCSPTCEQGCAGSMSCDEASGQCRHSPPTPRELGSFCPLTFQDERAASCGEGLICEPSDPYEARGLTFEFKGQGWCTQPCDRERVCPDGYGCVGSLSAPSEELVGVCVAGVINDPVFSLFDEGGGAEGGSPIYVPPEESPEEPSAQAEQGGSCQSQPSASPLAQLLVLLGALLIRRRLNAKRASL